MKDLRATKEVESDEKSSGAAAGPAVPEKMVQKNIEDEEKDVKVNKACSDVDEDKIINTLSEDIEKLNIKPEPKDEDGGPMAKRGPTGGIPVSMPCNVLGYQNKFIPMGPMGNYMPPAVSQSPPMKGNRRILDDEDVQPSKYVRAPVFAGSNCQDFQFSGFSNFTNCSVQNNLSNNLDQALQPEPMFNTYGQSDFGFTGFDSPMSTTLRCPVGMSGGEVTVQSPVSSSQMPRTGNIADDLIEEIEKQTFAQFRNGSLPKLEDSFSGDSFREMRRTSDPADSGIESEGGSPWSDQAPSPASPLSVESGYGKSPMHESQYQVSVSPHYPGSTSPASYRGTPSPAATSGYGSPGQPFYEESNDLINAELLEDAMAVITADLNKEEMKKRQKQVMVTQQAQGSKAVFNTTIPATMQPLTVKVSQPNITATPVRSTVVIPGGPAPNFQPQTFPTTSLIPVTTSAGTQQIIILPPPSQQQPSNQQVILVPVATSPAPQKPTGFRQYKKIAPKITTTPNTSTTAGSSVTTMTRSGPVTTSADKTGQVANRNMSQQNQQALQQQNRLLMIARRTVADIPREDLRKCDDEGDTYLHIAVCKTDKHMVQALLERLHREKLVHLVDQENMKRQTPLYLAAFINQPVMVAMFIKFQANVNVLAQTVSSDGHTTEVKAAIHVAASQGQEYHRTLVELLKAKDISINIVNNYGQTALHCAILAHGKLKRNGQDRIDSVDIIKTLIKTGADPAAQDKKSGKTPLMYAIEQRSLLLVETILNIVDPDKVKNVVKTQAFDGSSCLKIAEGLKGSLEVEIWNKLWNMLQCAASGSFAKYHIQSLPFVQQPVL